MVLLVLLALIPLYLHGAYLQNHLVNTIPHQTDQGAYSESAQKLRETNYHYLVPRNRMPVYPLLQSLNYTPGMSEEAFFSAGKNFNTLLSLIILIILYLVFKRFFPPLMTLNLMLITSFTFFMFKAPFFQSELLFYLLSFLAFLLMLKMLVKPTIYTGIVTGIILGIAHMTKASVIPALLLLCFFLGVGILVDFVRHQPYKTILRQKTLPIFLLLLTFLASISVYILNSKRVYGQYFYNVNSTFYPWYDSWDEAKAGTIAHGDRAGWPDLPEEEIPSPIKYFREHTLTQIWHRIQVGLLGILFNTLPSYGYFIYFVIYSLLFISLSSLNWRQCVEKFKHNYLLISFLIAYFVFHLLAVAWYTPIAAGNRFILAYFLPYMFVLFYIFRSAKRHFGSQASQLLSIINVIVFITLIGHIYYIMTSRIGTFYGGL